MEMQVARQSWKSLIEHCRMTGGDPQYAKAGASLKYGINVSHVDQTRYLDSVGKTGKIWCFHETV